MIAQEEPDARILRSCRVLAAWNWMSRLSTDPDEVVRQLNIEARAMADLAMDHPSKAPAVRQLVIAYKSLANSVMDRAADGNAPAANPQQPHGMVSAR